MTRNVFRMGSSFALALLLVGVSGCWGPSQFDVQGQVTYNGSPLRQPGGKIVFVGPHETQVAADIGEDGFYRANKVAAGLNRIAHYYPNPNFKVPSKRRSEQPPATLSEQSPFLTPSKYAAVDSSDLSVPVEEGTVFNTDLTGPAIE